MNQIEITQNGKIKKKKKKKQKKDKVSHKGTFSRMNLDNSRPFRRGPKGMTEGSGLGACKDNCKNDRTCQMREDKVSHKGTFREGICRFFES